MRSRFTAPLASCRRNKAPKLLAFACSGILCLTLLCPALPFDAAPGAAQAATQPKAAKAPAEAASAEKSSADQPAATENGFSFLDVDKNAKIDPTRKASFQDYKLRPEHSCIGCWCNHAFGNRLNESLYDLNEKSETFQAAWKRIETCLEPKYNAVPQIRSLFLQPKFADTAYSKVALYFSEFLDKPLAFTLVAANPDSTLEELTRRFGAPVVVDATWYLWQLDGDFLLLDLFDKKYKKQTFGIIHAYFLSALDAHLAAVRKQADSQVRQQEKGD